MPIASLVPTRPKQGPLLIDGSLIGDLLGVLLAVLVTGPRRVAVDPVSGD